jgi:hypothetical protein
LIRSAVGFGGRSTAALSGSLKEANGVELLQEFGENTQEFGSSLVPGVREFQEFGSSLIPGVRGVRVREEFDFAEFEEFEEFEEFDFRRVRGVGVRQEFVVVGVRGV